MKRYEADDVVTFYFVIMKADEYGEDRVQAWSDDKEIIKLYLEFHKCPKYRLKKITKTMRDIADILNENNHDEIQMYNITVRDPKHPHKAKQIVVPATTTEQLFINEEVNSFMASHIDYGLLSSVIPYMKPKYRKIFDQILLTDVIMKTVHGQSPASLQHIEMDQLSMLFQSFPDHFGV